MAHEYAVRFRAVLAQIDNFVGMGRASVDTDVIAVTNEVSSVTKSAAPILDSTVAVDKRYSFSIGSVVPVLEFRCVVIVPSTHERRPITNMLVPFLDKGVPFFQLDAHGRLVRHEIFDMTPILLVD